MVWTRFDARFTCFSPNTKHKVFLVNAPIEKAKLIFYNRTGHSPNKGCRCCGDNFRARIYPSLNAAAGCPTPEEIETRHDDEAQVEKFCENRSVMVIWSDEFEPEDLEGRLPK